ncbi:MAG: MFS transporter [Tuberibacillus sp.]
MKNTFAVFKKMDYTRLFLASLTSRMGSIIGMTAFSFYLLDRFSHQPFYVSLTEMMYSVPMLAVFFIVGVLADRMDRKKIAANCEWISAALSLALMGMIAVGWMPLIFAILFLRSAVNKFFFPAESGLVQGILSEKEYTAAAGLNQMTQSLFMLFGNGLGIACYWMFGVQGAVLTDAITFIISGILIHACKVSEAVRLPNGPHKISDLSFKMMLSDYKDGLVYALKHKLLFNLLIGFFVFGAVNGSLSVITVFMLKYKLVPETYEMWSIWEGIMFGSGILIGSIVASAIAHKFKIYQLLYGGLFLGGILIGAIAFINSVWVYLLLTFCVALSLPAANIAIGGWLPKIVDPKMMGRVEGTISPLMMVSQTVALGLIAWAFPKFFSISGIFLAVSIMIVGVSVFFAIVLPKLAKEHDKPVKTTAEMADAALYE